MTINWISLGCGHYKTSEDVVAINIPPIFWNLRAPNTWNFLCLQIKLWSLSCKFPFHIFSVVSLNEICSYFSCLAESCNSVLLWSSRNVLWTTRRHLTLYHHGGKDEDWSLIFWVNCSFNSVQKLYSSSSRRFIRTRQEQPAAHETCFPRQTETTWTNSRDVSWNLSFSLLTYCVFNDGLVLPERLRSSRRRTTVMIHFQEDILTDRCLLSDEPSRQPRERRDRTAAAPAGGRPPRSDGTLWRERLRRVWARWVSQEQWQRSVCDLLFFHTCSCQIIAVFAGGKSPRCLVCVRNVSVCGGENSLAAAVVATVKSCVAVKQFGLEYIELSGPSRPGQTDSCCGSCWCFGQTDARTVAWRQDCCCLASTVARCVPGVCCDAVWMNVCVDHCFVQHRWEHLPAASGLWIQTSRPSSAACYLETQSQDAVLEWINCSGTREFDLTSAHTHQPPSSEPPPRTWTRHRPGCGLHPSTRLPSRYSS